MARDRGLSSQSLPEIIAARLTSGIRSPAEWSTQDYSYIDHHDVITPAENADVKLPQNQDLQQNRASIVGIKISRRFHLSLSPRFDCLDLTGCLERRGHEMSSHCVTTIITKTPSNPLPEGPDSRSQLLGTVAPTDTRKQSFDSNASLWETRTQTLRANSDTGIASCTRFDRTIRGKPILVKRIRPFLVSIQFRGENSVNGVIARSETTKQSPLGQAGRLLRCARNDMAGWSIRRM